MRRSLRTVSVWVLTAMPSAHGVVHEAGTPFAPSTSTRHIRQEPKAFSESVAQSLGMGMPASVAARSTDVPAGTSTWRPSMVTETVPVSVSADCTAGVPKSTSGSQMLCP